MATFIILTSVIICMFLPSILFKKKGIKEYCDWGLGVDCCCYYSTPFSVHHRCIILIGFQEVLAEGTTISYSVVRKNWWGKKTVYGRGTVSGNFKNPHYFQVLIENIPNGANYQVEVYNGFTIAHGKFKVFEELLFTDPVSQSG